MIDYSAPYDAPISLDAGRVLGARPMRSTLWTFGAFAGGAPLIILGLMTVYLSTLASKGNEAFADLTSRLLLIVVGPTVIWWLACMVFRSDFGQRPAEYWLKAWARDRRLPRRLEGASLWQHHSQVVAAPRAVVEITRTTNLRMSDAEALSSTIKRLGAMLNGLRFPVQIVVRAWPQPGGLIMRRWFIAITSATDVTLKADTDAVVSGLARAGLGGHAKNGDLYDALQACWTVAPRGMEIGPRCIERLARHAIVDGEYVRGFVLSKLPKTTDANWLAPLLDGDVAVDCSIWLEPTDNADERAYLASRIVEWQAAQILNGNRGIPPDPDITDQINDATRTRLFLGRRELRVFRATFGFVVRGQTQTEMADREQLVCDLLREQVGDEALIPLDMEHDRAPLMVVPFGEPSVEYPIRTVTPAVARGYMFSNSSVSMPGGVDVGTSVGSKRTNTIDPFALDNPHMVELGGSGSGKGFWLKVYLWRMLALFPERRAWIIQTEKDEYSALTEAMPPYVYNHPDLGESPTGVVVRIASLDEFDSKVYAHKPVGWTRGARLTVYDLTRMAPADRGTAVAMLLAVIEADAARDHVETLGHVVIDELGIVLESPEAALAIDRAFRFFRSIPHRENPKHVSRRGLIGISQRPSDLLNHPRGKVLADLALTHVYFRQRATELKVVASKLGLSADEVRFLDEQCEAGTGLLVADQARVGFHLDATDHEKGFAKT